MTKLILIWGGTLALALALSAAPSTHVHYVGGTLSQLPAKASGTLHISDEDSFTFQASGATIKVPYRDVNLLEYGQRVSRRYMEAILISPIFLLSKRRAYFLSIGYTDSDGKQQAMVFQVSSKEIRPVLVSLEARSGRRVDAGRRSQKVRQRMSRFWWIIPFLPHVVFAIEPGETDQLLCIKRVFVDKLDGDQTALQMRDMLISALQQAHLFVVTENQDRADVFLRGSSDDLVFNESHSSSDGVNAHVQASTGSSAYKGGSFNKSVGGSLGENESSHSVERRHEASAAIRLVNKDGDVIWSSTQESQGSKFKGSMADVAEKITRQLSDDIAKARSARTPARP